MPTVRIPAGPSVAPSPLNGQPWSPAVPAGAFDNGASGLIKGGQQLVEASDKLDKTLFDKLEQDNKVAAKDAYIKFADAARGIDQDIKTNKTLRNAANSYSEGKASIEGLMRDMSGQLANPRQKELFDALAFSRADHYMTSWSDHAIKEMSKADDMGSKALIADGHNFAIENFTDPKAVAEGKNKIEIGMASLMKGADAESLRVATEAEISKMHRGVAERIGVGDAQSALDYMKQNEKEIRGDDRKALEVHLKGEVDVQKGQKAADEAWGKFGRNSNAAMDWFSKNLQGKARDKAQEEYKQRLGVAEHAEDRWREDAAASASVKILQSKTLDEANTVISGIKSDRVKAVALKLAKEMYPVEKPKEEFNPANVAKASWIRNAIDSKKEVEITTPGGPMKMTLDSPEKVAFVAAAMGLDNANRKDVIEYQQKGGLVSKIKVSDVDHFFKTYTDKKVEDAPAAYDYVLKQVQQQLGRMGREPTQADVQTAVKQALLTFKSIKEPAGADEFMAFRSSSKEKQVEVNSKYAKTFGVTESALNERITASGGKVDKFSQDAWLRTWFIEISPAERRRAAEALQAAGKKVDETSIRAFYVRYGNQ